MGPNFTPMMSSWFIGTFAVLHFLIVSVAGLAPITIYLMEGYSLKKEKPYLRMIGKQLLTIVIELAAVGGILGSAVVVVLVVLRNQPITLVINIFFWLLVLQLICFIAGLAFQFAYYFTWDQQTKNHRLWGLLAAILPLIPFVTFSAAISFLSTPGNWLQTGNLWDAVFNPSYILSLLHRAGAGMALLGALIIILNVFRRNKADGELREMYSSAVNFGGKMALRALEVQLILGVARIFVMPSDAAKMIMGRDLTMIWALGIAVAAIAWLFLFFNRKKSSTAKASIFLAAVVIPLILATTFMSITRSKSRGEFSIRDVMKRSDEIVALPKQFQAATAPDGLAIYNADCGACHPGLAGDAPSLAKQRHPDPDDLSEFLRDPAAFNKSMPPYQGSDEELLALVNFLLDIPAQ